MQANNAILLAAIASQRNTAAEAADVDQIAAAVADVELQRDPTPPMPSAELMEFNEYGPNSPPPPPPVPTCAVEVKAEDDILVELFGHCEPEEDEFSEGSCHDDRPADSDNSAAAKAWRRREMDANSTAELFARRCEFLDGFDG
jgi:type IV secretory pathway VirB10-like protein